MKKKLRITLGDQTYEVTVEVLEEEEHAGLSYHAKLPHPTGYTPLHPAAPSPAEQAGIRSTGGEKAEPSPPPSEPPQEPGMVLSPLAGRLTALQVKVGDYVRPGQTFAILDAMKMENAIHAPTAGHVVRIDVQQGQTVEQGQALLVIR